MKLIWTSLAILALTIPAMAQQKSLSCDRNGFNQNRLVTHCEMREQTIAYPGRISVDPGTNGGISVKGWDGGGVLVRSKVESAGVDDGAARIVGSQIQINTSGGVVNATGPDLNGDQNWSVSFEIFVPRQADLNLKANNGGITITGVNGNIQFHTMNGGVTLKELAGDVEGDTMNGGLNITLAGDRWNGNKLDARTTNGGINISMPQQYSAHFETGTVNGHLNLDFPMTVHGEIGRHLVTEIGSGGATIHVETTNGGVNVRRSS
ncbi:MAG TPA: DUF4097 family beta strand repeat-containing protein [Bryobacteraceae bacterium]|nr:DUF4097 family beta strand repeat-containing protein [Bryobacteraceae bacterium]